MFQPPPGLFQSCGEVTLECEPSDVLQTFQLLSDGKTLYWLYAQQTPETVTHPVTGEKVKHHPLYLQQLHFKVYLL